MKNIPKYIELGWKLVPIPAGTKGPKARDWNLEENCLKTVDDLPAGYGIGLAHAYSGTMALDVDDFFSASLKLAEHDIDLQRLFEAPDAVAIESGRSGHGKLLFKLPETLATKKIIINGITSFELRCATSNGLTVQDVLPPSIHPDVKRPYQWGGAGSYENLPDIPENLLLYWKQILKVDDNRNISVNENMTASWSEIKQALDFIDPSCSRDEWLSIGMALHWAGSQTGENDQALAIFNEWSKQSEDKYAGPKDIWHVWQSFRSENGIRIGTLFHLARLAGWERPAIDASSLFNKVDHNNQIKTIDSLRPPAPDMDLSLWPDLLATRAREVSESVGCDPIVPLFAGLSSITAAIDARIRLELMDGYKVPPILWLMTIGDPADKKTPGSKPMIEIIRDIQKEDRPRYKRELLEWEGRMAFYEASKKNYMDYMKSDGAILSEGEDAPEVVEAPTAPVPLKFIVSDVTSQKMIRDASERPRGLLCYLDEMNNWIKKVVDKSSGEDRSSWVQSYEGNHYEMDRVGAGNIYCENLAVSIYGNIQPQVFARSVKQLSEDGLLQRFIPGILRGNMTKLGNPLPDYMTRKDEWNNLVRKIYSINEGDYRLSAQAYNRFRQFQAWYEDMKKFERLVNSSPIYMTAFGKLEGTAGRLILIFHMIENPYIKEVSIDIVERVIKLIKTYIIPAYRYMFAEIGYQKGSVEEALHRYIIEISGDTREVTLSNIRRRIKSKLKDNAANIWGEDDIVCSIMDQFEDMNWVAKIEENRNTHHVVWMINPELATVFDRQREKIHEAKQKVIDLLRH